MLVSLLFIAAAAGFVTYADARLATQGSSNVAVYWGKFSHVRMPGFNADCIRTCRSI
jgi:hypothetical protein